MSGAILDAPAIREHAAMTTPSRDPERRSAMRRLRDSRAVLAYRMMRIRRAEETLAERYREQEMRTPTHFSIGQEAVAVGVCAALNRDDVVYSGHRCHAHYLAKGGALGPMIAE